MIHDDNEKEEEKNAIKLYKWSLSFAGMSKKKNSKTHGDILLEKSKLFNDLLTNMMSKTVWSISNSTWWFEIMWNQISFLFLQNK